jgi:cell wall-associated NlpC family hydrolase
VNFERYIGLEYCPPDKTGNGLNCWELVELVMRQEFNLTPPEVDFKEDHRLATPVFMRELEAWQPVTNGEEQPGDLVLFNMLNIYSHCGIVIDENRMLHILANRNAVIERFNSMAWTNRLIGFYRWLR